ncbi:MAG TPA: hypothetical protein VLE74_01310 [Candidatus Saccharimonadales bacterium]|nr:hypothetical protein [Candidatus Saccharimonadales bacterium]
MSAINILSDAEILGDQGYNAPGNWGRQDEFAYASAPVSSRLELVPSPRLADRFEGLSTEQVDLVQAAYNIFHAPYAKDSDEASPYASSAHSGMYGHINALHDDRLPDLIEGFKLFRKLNGEVEYSGVEPQLYRGNHRIGWDDYLRLAHEKKLPNSRDDPHDAHVHLMGELMATGDITELISVAGGEAMNWPKERQEHMVSAIDVITFNIKNIWQGPSEIRKSAGDLVKTIQKIQALRGKEDFTAADAISMAMDQVRLIQGWQKERLFLTPEVGKRALAHLLKEQEHAA